MSLLFAAGSPTTELTPVEVKSGLFEALGKLGDRRRVLAVPPDFTRFHSKAGELTEYVWEHFGDRLVDILPALGTHKAMTDGEIAKHGGSNDPYRGDVWRAWEYWANAAGVGDMLWKPD